MEDHAEIRRGALYHRYLPDGLEIVVYRMLYNYRLCVGEVGPGGGVTDAFCYADKATCMRAAAAWDGTGDPPDGWHRNPMTGRRRAGGDPTKEARFW